MGRRPNPPSYRSNSDLLPLRPFLQTLPTNSSPQSSDLDLFATDRGGALPTPRGPYSFWRANKFIIAAIVITFVVISAIALGITFGLRSRSTTPASSPSPSSAPSFTPSSPSTTIPSPSSLASGPTTLSIPIDLQTSFRSSSWIWLDMNGLSGVPQGDWAFRKTLPESTVPATEAMALITGDNSFLLYHNGRLVAADTDTIQGWRQSTAAHVHLDPNSNVFAIQIRNYPADSDGTGNTSAGLLASFQIKYADGSTSILSADDTWRAAHPVPSGFQFPTFDDSNWSTTVMLGTYGVAPWGTTISLPLDGSILVI
ncbi:hypothetical protein BD779DRAFT_1671020 [Infundibulicybe gibba]|nr:hypothetical protein BD779DRAFT_1671020 [Infundibulicybe gibba]